VLEALRDLGLDRQIIFNKNAGMILPSGVNKASGLTAALEELRISHHNVVSIGDAENDLPMLTKVQAPLAGPPIMVKGVAGINVIVGFCASAGSASANSPITVAVLR
jgi:3-deoxy-D-manno-octulosonate 8-phosphate phosphatase KdsC-like HAD superfamily phosphatase